MLLRLTVVSPRVLCMAVVMICYNVFTSCKLFPKYHSACQDDMVTRCLFHLGNLAYNFCPETVCQYRLHGWEKGIKE